MVLVCSNFASYLRGRHSYQEHSPIITFIIILLLPSALTFITLLIHRIRAARAAQRDRAPEDVVRNLPWRVWTGTGWEKHEGGEDANAVPDHVPSAEGDIEACIPTKDSNPGASAPTSTESSVPTPSVETEEEASTSIPPTQPENLPWFESQLECAICLCEFVKGDKVRVLPCHHIFHLHEVDEWLIQRKKLVCVLTSLRLHPTNFTPYSVLYAKQMLLNHRHHRQYDRTRTLPQTQTKYPPNQH